MDITLCRFVRLLGLFEVGIVKKCSTCPGPSEIQKILHIRGPEGVDRAVSYLKENKLKFS